MYIAIDVGGTSINIAGFKSLDPNTKFEQKIYKVKNNFNQDIQTIVDFICSLDGEVKGIGIGVPGLIDAEETQILSSANLSDWAKKDILTQLKMELKTTNVYLCHDVKAAALSESEFGKVTDNFAFVIWGTGIGCSYVRYLDGKPNNFQQVELGYQTIAKKIELNGESFPGYLEYHCGGGRLAQRFKKPVQELSEGDWSQIMDDMSDGLTNMLMLNPVPTFVFSGGVITKHAHRLDELKKLVKHKSDFQEAPNMIMSSFGEDAGLIGALGLIKLNTL